MSEKKLKNVVLEDFSKYPMLDELIGSSEQKNDSDNGDSLSEVETRDDPGEIISRLGRELVMQCLIRCPRSGYDVISSVNKSFMSMVHGEEIYRLRRCMGFVEPWIYFMADVQQWKAYDPSHRRFMDLPRLNSTDESFQIGCLAVGTELLVFPVIKCFKFVKIYNLVSNTWQTKSSTMNIPRWLFGAASKGEIAIFAGGRDSDNVMLSSVELYNSAFGTWTQLPNMKRTRTRCSAVFLNGMFYVIGGIGENNEVLTSGEVFDFDKKTWSEIPGMWPTRTNEVIRSRSPPLVAVVNDRLYAADHAGNQVLLYDIGNNTWSSVGNFPEQARSLTGLDMSLKGYGNRLLLISRKTKDCYAFELNACVPVQGQLQWELLARMRTSGCAVMEC